MWSKEKIRALTRSKTFLVTSVSTVSLGFGAAVGYVVAEKRLETKYTKIAEQEIEDAKKFYATLYKNDENADPTLLAQAKGYSPALSEEQSDMDLLAEAQEEVKEATKVLEDLHYKLPEPTDYTKVQLVDESTTKVAETQIIERNIFDEAAASGDHFNYGEEMIHRSPDRPYIISHDEFMESDQDFEQVSLTYYESDETLVDSADDVVPDIESTVGDDNLSKFGHGSKDENIVYIRNERLEIDFEVARSLGKYSEEVLGFLEHSDQPRRFRRDDG